jgi:ferredoxin
MKQNLIVPEKCTGCGACQAVCAGGAIAMKPGRLDFMVPVVDAERCVDCGRCAAVCPELHAVERAKEHRCYAAQAAGDRRSNA